MPRLSPALALLLLGCSAHPPPSPPAPSDGAQVSASRGRTWDAVVDIFAARNMPIGSIERVSGIIATEELPVGPEGRRWADCGTSSQGSLRPDRAIYNVLVKGDSSTATVNATVRWVGSSEESAVIQCSTTHIWEQDFEHDVKTRAEQFGVASARAHDYQPADTTPVSGAGPAPNRSSHTTQLGSDVTVPPAAAGIIRSNADLLTSESFRRAIGDMQRKGFLLGYRETDQGVLDVELSASALTGPTLEYQLTRLFLAYGSTLTGGSYTTLVLRANGQQIGRYTREGINWDASSARQ